MFSFDVALFAYFSPEQYLPATSIIASVIGFVMMFGKNTWRIVSGRVRQMMIKKSTGKFDLKGPHTKPANRLREKTPKV